MKIHIINNERAHFPPSTLMVLTVGQTLKKAIQLAALVDQTKICIGFRRRNPILPNKMVFYQQCKPSLPVFNTIMNMNDCCR